ncbi:hypothetical protein AVL63_01550 [Nesterenkonia jeotgali]|uniref:Phosphoribosyltransferase domain-containing protein n=1 Tax=Nesterenkonia jeotgali TaxID=317018 RepID=A0A0W8IFN7_9MICC|nr:hypothetical protein AVL63_01550 [Nesterenkonia jeotgali]
MVLCPLCAEDLHLLTRAPFAAEEQAMALPLLLEEQEMTVLPVSAAARYEALVARSVLAFKDHGAIGLGAALGPGLARALRLALERAAEPGAPTPEPAHGPAPGRAAGAESLAEPRPAAGPATGPEPSAEPEAEPEAAPGAEPGAVRPRVWWLVSPPSSLRSRLSRGFDPVQVLLRHALGATGGELEYRGHRLRPGPGLVRPSRTATLGSLNPRHARQKSRGAQARRRRSVGSIALTRRGRALLPGAEVLLVDDVLTSGSTLAELHRVLSCAGARVHGAAVFAAAPGPGAAKESSLVRASPEA